MCFCKVKLVIWLEGWNPVEDNGSVDLIMLAKEAESGCGCCTSIEVEEVEDPESDPDYVDCLFFHKDGE